MKRFPRIYSLCTVGLIHHGEYEYLFHPFRTDFVGDSGSGKSMVADLLQLILVGSDKFESVTEGANEKRTVDGMVLATTDTSGIGYAFLNVEVAPKQYIVVGASLQSGNQRTRAFIVQEGNLFVGTSLKPLSAPLSYAELIQQSDNAILPLEQLGLHLLEQGVVLRTYEQFTEFHALLIANRLLPLKPTTNQQAISDYAKVIRSFARGYKVKANKSNALQEFLFGRSERHNLLDKLRHVQQEIDKNIHAHNRNIDDVEEFKAKLADFKELLRREAEHKQTKTDWTVANYHFTQHTRQQCQQNVKSLCKHLNQEFARLATIYPIVDTLQNTLPKAEEAANKAYQDAVGKKAMLEPIEQAVDTVKKWLFYLGSTATLEQLADKFKLDQQRRTQRERINSLLTLLNKINLTEAFQNSAWSEGYEVGYEQHQQQLSRLNASIREKTQLAALANLDDPASLAYWASQLDRPLTLEEESLLRHFQQFPTTKPTREISEPGDRYIPSAKNLFEKPQLTTDEDVPAIYWVNLSGVWECIEQVKDPLFTTDDKQALREKLHQWNSDLQNEIQQLTEQSNTLTTLSTFLRSSEISNVTDLLSAYSERTQVKQFVLNSEWAMAPGDFDKLLIQYRTYATRIEVDVKQASKVVEDAFTALNKVSKQSTCLNQITQLLDAWPPSTKYINALSQILPARPEFTLRIDALLTDPADSSLTDLLTDLSARNQNRVALEHWCNELTLLLQAEQRCYEAEKQYLNLHNQLPVELEEVDTEKIDQLQNLTNHAWTRYEDEYNRLTKRYLSQQEYLVDDPTCNFMTLANEVLPLPLRKTVKSADDIISAIETELLRINGQVRLIANSVIQDAGKVVAELGQIINDHKAARSAIQTFFQNQIRPITNNCNVKLSIRQGMLNDEWIIEFANLIDSLETPLFSSTTMDAESLRDKKDLISLIQVARYRPCQPPG